MRDALPLLRDSILVLNGHSYCQTDLTAFLGSYQNKRSQALLVSARVPDVSRFGNVEFDCEQRIQRFGEKSKSGPGWIDVGIYAISKRLIADIPDRAQVSIERDCFRGWTEKRMFAYTAATDKPGRFLDIGTPDTLEVAQKFFAPVLFGPNSHGARCVLLDRDGTLIVEKNYLRDPSDVELIPGAPAALRQLRCLGLSIVLVSNQSGIARGFLDDQTLCQIHERLRVLLADADVALDAIYYCPHLPELGCACRKPEPGMVERAARDLGFDPRNAFVIGDKACDMELGSGVGATTLLVRTGYGQQTSSAGVQADYVMQDLSEAAAVIAHRVKLDAKATVR